MTGALLDRPLRLEPYISQNFMGFFVAEDDANYLKRLALQYVKEVSNSSMMKLLAYLNTYNRDTKAKTEHKTN